MGGVGAVLRRRAALWTEDPARLVIALRAFGRRAAPSELISGVLRTLCSEWCTARRCFHNLLAVKHASFDAATQYTAKLKDRCRDPAGRLVDTIHKGSKAGRPPHVVRRGELLHPFCTLSSKCLKDGEELQPHHIRSHFGSSRV